MYSKTGQQVYTATADRLAYLYDRWRDECQYEDFQAYVDNARKLISTAGGTMQTMTRRPFAVTYRATDGVFKLVATSRAVRLYQVQEQANAN